jgi:F-type H+-transporting ATPase subunit b
VQISWFTLGAQIVNFLILLFLLQRFLYGPIVKAMEDRETLIASRLEDAEEKRGEAEKEAERYRQQQQELKLEEERISARAEKEVAEQRKKLLEKVRAEAEDTEKHWHEAIQEERDRFLRDLRERASEQVVDMLRQALLDLADADLEQQMVDVFTERLGELGGPDKQDVAESIQKSGGRVVIRSAFSIPEEARKTLVEIVVDRILDGSEVQVRFEVSPDIICGIELQADGRLVAWSIEDYLDSVEEHVRQTLEQELTVQTAGEEIEA